MTEFQNNPVYSKNVMEMLTVANDFCLTLSKTETTQKENLINYLQKVCPLLYLKGSLMPDIEIKNPEANERFFTEEEWESLFNMLRNKFGKDDEYWIIDIAANHNDPVKASLAESLTDIFQEMKDFLTLYQKNSLDAKENAVFELKTSFEKRWGMILLNAHRQLHFLKTKGLEPEIFQDIPELF